VEASTREERVGDFEVQDDVDAGGHSGAAGDCHPRGRIGLGEERAIDLRELAMAYI
jgi:hypothetical protein